MGCCVILGPVYRICLGNVWALEQNFTEREHIDVCCETSNLGYSSCLGRNVLPLESLHIYKMGSNGKIVFVAEVFAFRSVVEGGINIINSTNAVLLYNPTKRFRTS
jgi:hypothetical protein